MGEKAYNGVQEAAQLLTQNKPAEAIDKLTKLLESGGDFDKAVVNYNLGFAYSAREDYVSATDAFARALQLNVLPQQQHEQLQYNLGQLYIAASKPNEGISTLQAYVNESCGKVPAEAHIFLANALSQQQRYKEALPEIDRAIGKAGGARESWLQLKLAISYELKDYKACAQALVALIAQSPDKADYWKQLSSMYLQLKQDTEAVAVLALAQRQGLIDKPADLVNLYNVYMMMELPYKAGELLQRAIEDKKLPADEKHLEQLANAWINAREARRAETVLKQLASVSERGEHYYKLGAMYGDEERWKESAQMLTHALEKGGLKRAGEAWMRLAVARHGLQNVSGAVAALRKAAEYDTTRRQAGEWLRHLQGQTAS